MAQDDKRFVVYKSSAGSGKTYTLVREYLKIVLKNPENFRRILAITFTNKAANELKERVVRYLVILAEPDRYPGNDAIRFLLPQLCDQLKMTEAQVSARALAVLRLIMHNYAEFAISTIDSFTHRIIRTFAFDLKIPMNFEVELDSDTLLEQSVDTLLSQVGIDGKLTRVLTDFIEKKAGEERSWRIEKDLFEFGKALMKEDSIEALSELRRHELETFMAIREKIHRWKNSFEADIKAISVVLLQLASRAELTETAVRGKSRGVLTYLKKLSEGKYDKLVPGRDAHSSLETGDWLHKEANQVQQRAFEAIRPEIEAKGNHLMERISQDQEKYVLSRLLLTHLFSTALLSEIEKILDALCRDNNKLLIGEFNRRISGIVREQPAPFIYERLGEKYHHFLLDEFQDTSVLQWHNLLPLIENSLASARLNLVVGDAKQAIYRWRSGDAEQFESLPHLINTCADPLSAEREHTLVREYREETLDTNHRSSPLIIGFNNRFFGTIQPLLPETHGGLYRHAQQKASKLEKPGMVRIETAMAPDDERSYPEVVHEKIMAIIRELEEDQYRWSDMAILCRRNEEASQIASYLISQGVRVISAESLLLTQSANVNFMMAWILHLNDRSLDIPMVHILEYLRKSGRIQPGILLEMFSADKQASGPEEDGKMKINRFRKVLADHFPDFNYQLLKRLDLLGITHYLSGYFKLNPGMDSYLRFFMDAVLRFMATYKGGLQEFASWWEAESGKTSVVIPEGINAVSIMTIHKAKGLQFPVVIYPFADERVRSTRKNAWVQTEEEFLKPLNIAYLPMLKALEETRFGDLYREEISRSHIDMVNLLYVALTRPEERLYIITKTLPEKTDRHDSLPKLFTDFLKAEGNYEAGKSLYQYGERWKNPMKSSDEEKVTGPEEAIGMSAGALNLLLRRHAPMAWNMEEPDRNREWGNLVHLAFSRIYDPGQASAVIDEMLTEGLINTEQHAGLARIVDQLMQHPDVAFLFNPAFEVKNEPEILTKEGEIYRPDRVMMRGNEVMVVDYKTGKQKENHTQQVIHYGNLMQQMGYTLHGAYLLYLNQEPALIRVI